MYNSAVYMDVFLKDFIVDAILKGLHFQCVFECMELERHREVCFERKMGPCELVTLPVICKTRVTRLTWNTRVNHTFCI